MLNACSYSSFSAPLPVQSLSVLSVSTSTIKLTWVQGGNGGYDSFRIISGGSVHTVDSSQNEFVLTGLSPTSLYDVTIQTRFSNISSENVTENNIATCE